MTISFIKEGYDPFITFLKAYAIICVVLAHAIPAAFRDVILFELWGDMQVPLFILIQVFHSYKRAPSFSFKRIWGRILKPFLIVQLVIFLIYLFSGASTISDIFFQTAIQGGKGPGSYYIWVYVQIALLLVLMWPIITRYSVKQLLVPFILLCISIDFLCSIIHMPEWLYRLMALRYIFLIYLGVIWVKEGVNVNYFTVAISVISILATLYFNYTTSDLEPLFFTTNWKTHRWICYFYVSNLLVFVLWKLYNMSVKSNWVSGIIRIIGDSSYEIYLMQMMVFLFLPSLTHHIWAKTFSLSVIVACAEILLCIVSGIVLHKFLTQIKVK